jgi:hypothetical protein
MRLLLGIPHPLPGARLRPSNTGVTVWEHEPGLDQWVLDAFNDAGHLAELEASDPSEVPPRPPDG